MATPMATYARELEVLVARAARTGSLDPADLMSTYTKLMPGAHPHVANERRLDLQGIVEALAMLPDGVLHAPAVRVVPKLEAFGHAPAAGGSFPAGRMEDGTLLIEAGRGLVGLLNLAAPLCLLAYEAAKARRLLEAAGLARIPANDLPTLAPAADSDEHSTSDNVLFDLEPEPEQESDEAAMPQRCDDQGTSPDASGDNDENSDPPLGEIAFQLGIDEAALFDADERTGGGVLVLMLSDRPLPVVMVHADLDPIAVAHRATGTARRLLEMLAEMGLAARPLHLWIGADVITDCLSPYARELRSVLLAWAAQNAGALEPDVAALLDSPGEDLLYAVMHDFLRSRSGLLEERARADRTVGILRSLDDEPPFEIVDLGRVDASLCDARVPHWRAGSPAPVLLRLTQDVEDDEATALRTLLEAVAAQISGVTLVFEGTMLGGAGGILLPHLMLRWAGEEKISVPAAAPLDPDELSSLTDLPVRAGAVLSVSSAALLSPVHVSELAQAYDVGAVEVGGASILSALADARWRGTIRPEVPISWALVGGHRVSSGRPSVETLGACAALAVTTLRRIAGEPPPRAMDSSPQPEHPRRQSSRAMFIKA